MALLLAVAAGANAQAPPCRPCAGIRVDDPSIALASLASQPQLDEGAIFYVSWSGELDGSIDEADFDRIREAGAVPWLRVTLRAPQPIRLNVQTLDAELRDLARLAAAAGRGGTIQIDWQPSDGVFDAADFAFAFKRAAVAVTGARAETRVAIGPLRADPALLRTLYAEEIAAYADWIAVLPSSGNSQEIAEIVDTIAELDAGKPLVVDGLPWPQEPERALAAAANAASQGAAVTLFEAEGLGQVDLAVLKTLAREFDGDLSYDPYTTISGAERSWIFVRGDDLSLRVIAELDGSGERAELLFDDRQLRDPQSIDTNTGARQPVVAGLRTLDGLLVRIDDPGSIALLSVERVTVEELGGQEERLEIAGGRQMPVEEILRRLQAFEDEQARRLRNYQARNVLHLRFQVGASGIEAAYEGPFFFDREGGFDWVWESFYIDGVKWRSKRMPEMPMITPEKAAVLPLEITFSKEYRYRLRGTAIAEGRDCWVIDFRPLAATPGGNLHQGTVWVDREIYARVRTKAIQLGLENEVISNEETLYFRPIDEDGAPATWSPDSYVLPMRVVGQQLLSVLNATLPLETETQLTEVRINAPDFESNRQAAYDSDATMVRDTEKGIRYLRRDENGERFVEEKIDQDRLFIVGGVFWDESLDYPIPLAGVNYLSLDLFETGTQLNLFFAGPLLTVNWAEPRLFDSRWDAGVNLFGFFIDGTDTVYRNGSEVLNEEIESNSSSAAVFVGRPLGQFFKLDLSLRVASANYSRSENTDDDLILPVDTKTTSLALDLSYNRGGYRVGLQASEHERDRWAFWGQPGNQEFDPAQKEYTRYRATFAKTWWLQNFRSFGFHAEFLDGENLDRFSRFDFGIFGDSTVAGYQSGLVRADEARGIHVNYGLNFGDLFRLEAEGDVVWATALDTGLDNELLAGVGLEGSFPLPWQLLTNFEIGYAVAGPGEGSVAARIVFLKLFPKKQGKRKKGKGKP
jgi:hypothetical protein